MLASSVNYQLFIIIQIFLLPLHIQCSHDRISNKLTDSFAY